jgi:hypothetical protein
MQPFFQQLEMALLTVNNVSDKTANLAPNVESTTDIQPSFSVQECQETETSNLQMEANVDNAATINCSPGTVQRDIYAKGSKTFLLSLKESLSADDLFRMIEEKTKIPRSLLHVTVGGQCLNDQVVQQMQSGTTLHYTVKGQGGMQSPDTGRK